MSLKILVTSDFHAKEDLKEAAIEEANSGEYNLFINLGDFIEEEYARQLFDRIEIPGIGCTGNRDMMFSDDFLDSTEVPVYNFLEATVDDEYLVILIGGDFPDDVKQKVYDLIDEHGDPNKVLIGSHYPPKKVGDKIHSGDRIGFDQFREIIMRKKPAVWVNGHVHEDFGDRSLMKTRVLNAAGEETGKAFSVTLGENGVEEVEEINLLE